MKKDLEGLNIVYTGDGVSYRNGRSVLPDSREPRILSVNILICGQSIQISKKYVWIIVKAL